MNNFYLPLMSDNIDKEDVKAVIDFLSQDQIPKLTNGPKVIEFENAWGEWLGTKYNLMVNSGASANELTMLAMNYLYGEGEIIVPPLTWISDISSVIFSGMKPVFCDINLKNFSFDIEKCFLIGPTKFSLINSSTRAIAKAFGLFFTNLSYKIRIGLDNNFRFFRFFNILEIWIILKFQ